MKAGKLFLVITCMVAIVSMAVVYAYYVNMAEVVPQTSNRELSDKLNNEMNLSNMETEQKAQESPVAEAEGKADGGILSDSPAAPVGKVPPNGNPVLAHKFGADPYALVFEDRVYLYNTNDVIEYDKDGNVKENSYSSINKLSVISSADLVNWTDHGVIHVAGPDGAAKWATQSWAPAAAHKVIDGKDQFFLYFANNASGIGVLTSDSPLGPWVDPIGKPLVARTTPGVEKVTWLFDPAVLVDDDGKAYIYFGGGIPEGEFDMPNTARVMQLGDDMISVLGEAVTVPAPFMFEDSGINKVNGKYYYTYCSNFLEGTRPENSPPPGEIAYMVSDHPMGPWTYQGTILKNPGHFFGVGGNNHHAIFQFHQNWYIAYHAQTLSKAMGVPKGYRSTHLNRVTFEADGSIAQINADMQGVEAIQPLDPFQRNQAATMAWNAGIQVDPSSLAVTDIHNNDWIAAADVDFGNGASKFSAWVSSVEGGGQLELRLDDAAGELVGSVRVPQDAGSQQSIEVTAEVSGASGRHHLFIVFKGEQDGKLFEFEGWQFHH